MSVSGSGGSDGGGQRPGIQEEAAGRLTDDTSMMSEYHLLSVSVADSQSHTTDCMLVSQLSLSLALSLSLSLSLIEDCSAVAFNDAVQT